VLANAPQGFITLSLIEPDASGICGAHEQLPKVAGRRQEKFSVL